MTTKIFFDFDDVLFNTQKFKEDLVDCFDSLGVKRIVHDETYQQARARAGVFNYQFDLHLSLLEERGYNVGQVRRSVMDFLALSHLYVFDDVVKCFADLKSQGYEIYIVSFGTLGWQDIKIAHSGISECVQEVVTGEIDKGIEIATRSTDKDIVWFVDDRVDYLEQVKCHVPAVRALLMKRPEGRFDDMSRDYCEVSSINEVSGIIGRAIKEISQ